MSRCSDLGLARVRRRNPLERLDGPLAGLGELLDFRAVEGPEQAATGHDAAVASDNRHDVRHIG